MTSHPDERAAAMAETSEEITEHQTGADQTSGVPCTRRDDTTRPIWLVAGKVRCLHTHR